MSTRNTVAYGDNYHVYSECFEENKSVYLELSVPDLVYEVSPNELIVRIPKDIMLAILDNATEIRVRLNGEDWNMTQDPQEWKKRDE